VNIVGIRILPPLAIGRLGASSTPLESYDLEVSPDDPLGFRRIVGRATLEVSPERGDIARQYRPQKIEFRDAEGIRPVAPFLEVYAQLADGALVPLTVKLLEDNKLTPEDVRWSVHVANIKAYRRTQDDGDRIEAKTGEINDHAVHPLLGKCPHFLPGKVLPLGSVRYIRPSEQFPEIRLRFTPAKGFVYGASAKRKLGPNDKPTIDRVFEDHPERIIYNEHVYSEHDKTKSWFGYREASGPGPGDPHFTNPAQIFAGYSDGSAQVSWGYLDDECDGVVSVRIDPAKTPGVVLEAFSRIGAGPPAFAPDSLPIRTVADELEQVLLGPSVDAHGVRIEDALEIVRRAFESVRLMNTAVMNGNATDGRVNVASTMVRQDTNDMGRRFEPIAAASIVDTLAILALHERVYTALQSGAAPWFESLLRRPEEIGDLTDEARRKMPALMRGADGRYLTLTRRAARSSTIRRPRRRPTRRRSRTGGGASRRGTSPRRSTTARWGTR
jgi:hypothetical protein